MKRLLRHRPSPAIVIACLALAVALSGTSYAAVAKLLPKNSVSSAQVINGSLQTVDLSKRAKAALKGARGAQGIQGRKAREEPWAFRAFRESRAFPGQRAPMAMSPLMARSPTRRT
jgi:hypothetical protein